MKVIRNFVDWQLEEKPVITAYHVLGRTILLLPDWCECVTVGIYMTKIGESVKSTFRALTILSNVTFRLFIVFKLSYVHETFHLWLRKFATDIWCTCSIINGTLLEDQRTLSAVTRIPLEGFYWKFSDNSYYAICKNAVPLINPLCHQPCARLLLSKRNIMDWS